MHLYLIRHGESFLNLPDWHDYTKDYGLTERGHQQAAALAQWAPGNLPKPDMLYASTMARARETAAHLGEAFDMTATLDDRWREIGNNRLDHTPLPSDGLARYADFWATERPFSNITPDIPNGETLIHFRARIGMALDDVLSRHIDETVVVVCHGFVIDTVFDLCFNIGTYRRCEVWTRNTGIIHFEYVNHPGREHWRLYRQNWIEHLSVHNVGHLE